jgi:hypothetical protein
MRGFSILRIIFGLILIGALVALGVYVYNAGVAQGIASGTQLQVPEGGAQPAPYYYPHFYRPFGFGFLWFLGPLFFLFLILGLMRAVFFGGRRRHHYGFGHGPWKWSGSKEEWKDGIPPRVAEWHRKLHSEEPQTEQEQ